MQISQIFFGFEHLRLLMKVIKMDGGGDKNHICAASITLNQSSHKPLLTVLVHFQRKCANSLILTDETLVNGANVI